MLRLAFDFIITWRETRTRPNAYICGTLGALSSIGCLFYPGPNQILIFAPVFIFMMVIPGHVLNHAARKQKKS